MKKLEQKLQNEIATISNFPKKGIEFKDLQSILSNPELVSEIVDVLTDSLEKDITAIVGLDSRGFLFGMILAKELRLPFVMLRKPGKLPPPIIAVEYEKEYGVDIIEVREGVLGPNDRVHIHDDLLATGGSAFAAKRLVEKTGAQISGYSFIMELPALNGRDALGKDPIVSLVKFDD